MEPRRKCLRSRIARCGRRRSRAPCLETYCCRLWPKGSRCRVGMAQEGAFARQAAVGDYGHGVSGSSAEGRELATCDDIRASCSPWEICMARFPRYSEPPEASVRKHTNEAGSLAHRNSVHSLVPGKTPDSQCRAQPSSGGLRQFVRENVSAIAVLQCVVSKQDECVAPARCGRAPRSRWQ